MHRLPRRQNPRLPLIDGIGHCGDRLGTEERFVRRQEEMQGRGVGALHRDIAIGACDYGAAAPADKAMVDQVASIERLTRRPVTEMIGGGERCRQHLFVGQP